jgi:hypothetical protein
MITLALKHTDVGVEGESLRLSGNPVPRPTLYTPLSGSRSLWLELVVYLGYRVSACRLLGREEERR